MGKKIEPTDAMVEAGASSAWEEANPGILGWNSISERHKEGCRRDARAVLTAALNHPDTAGLFTDEDTLRAAREQGWDQATRWIDSYQGGPNGRTDSARSANPHRTVPELPTKCGTVIVANDGHKFIKAEVDGIAHRAREAVLGANGWWYGAWRKAEGDGLLSAMFPEHISAPTWKVEGE